MLLLCCCCGFAGSRDGLCFLSDIGGGGNTRLVPGSACLVGAARPPWNKFPPISVHLAVMCSVGGGGSVGLIRLGSEAPRRDSDGVELGLFFFFDSSLFFPFLLLLVLCKSLGKRRRVARPPRKARRLMGGYGGCAAAFHCLHLRFGLMVEDCGLCARFGEQMGVDGRVGGGRSTIAVGTWL